MLVHTLGGLGLSNSSFQRQKPLLLLSYLAIEGEQERRFISELFWPEAKHARSSLSVALSQLIKVDNSLIIRNNNYLKANLKSDVNLLIDAFSKQKYKQVIKLYKGAFLETLDIKIGIELEEWIYKQREFIALQVQDAYLSLAINKAKLGDFGKAAKLAHNAYKLKGLDYSQKKNIQEIYILLKAANSPYIKQLEDFNFDISIEQARAHFSTTPSLPKAKSTLIGRKIQIKEITSRIAKDDCRLISIIGTGGNGKTRLALHIANDLSKNQSFKDGVYYIALETAKNIADLNSFIAQKLKINLDKQKTKEQIIAWLAKKEVLLVLDNLEHLISANLLLSEYLNQCPNLKILLSSRERLNISDEWVLVLKGLPYPKNDIKLAEAKNFEAIKLFVSRAKRARLDFELTTSNLPEIIKITNLLAGSPLGLEIAASWLKMMPCSEIAQEIENSLHFLNSTQEDIPDRQKSARAVFEYSWKLLNPQEQSILKKLSVFQDGFDRQAALEVVGSSLSQLSSLVDKSLIQLDNTKYQRHPLIYQFCEEKLAADAQLKSTSQAKHANYFLTQLTNKTNKIIIVNDFENVRLAWQWAIRNKKWSLLAQASYALAREFHLQSQYLQGLEFFEQAMLALGAKKDKALAYFLISKALLNTHLGYYSDAKKDVTKAMKIIANTAPNARYWGLTILAHNNYLSGDYQNAKKNYLQILRSAQINNNREQSLDSLAYLATIEQHLNNHKQAKDYYQKIITAYRHNKNQHGLVTALLNLGTLELNRGNSAQAKIYYQESLELAQKINQKSALAILWHNLALIACKENKHQKAEELATKALNLVQESNEKAKEAGILASLSWLMTCANDYLRAKIYLINSLQIAEDLKDTPAKLTALLRLAQLQSKQNNISEALVLSQIINDHPAALAWVKNKARALSQALNTKQDYKLTNNISLEILVPQILEKNSRSFN